MKMQINIHARTFSAKFLPLLNDYSHRWEIYKGSAGSGKSHFITQKIIIKALNFLDLPQDKIVRQCETRFLNYLKM